MKKVTYLINVAFKGMHDYTVTVDRNGPDNTNRGTANFVKRNLQACLGPDYSVTMDRVEVTRETFQA